MVERVKEVLGDSVHSMDECDFGNRVWVLEKGDYCQVMLPFNVRYRKRKKNGDPEQRLTNADTKLAINYCPFCGTKFEGKGRLISGFFHTSVASPRRLSYDNRRPSTAH
ncbi:hypothetical protein ACMFY2_13815 [Enterobacter cloacae subsp. cloacae]